MSVERRGDRPRPVARSVVDVIGDTPVVELSRLTRGLPPRCPERE